MDFSGLNDPHNPKAAMSLSVMKAVYGGVDTREAQLMAEVMLWASYSDLHYDQEGIARFIANGEGCLEDDVWVMYHDHEGDMVFHRNMRPEVVDKLATAAGELLSCIPRIRADRGEMAALQVLAQVNMALGPFAMRHADALVPQHEASNFLAQIRFSGPQSN